MFPSYSAYESGSERLSNSPEGCKSGRGESKLRAGWFGKASTEKKLILCSWARENGTSLYENSEWGLRNSDNTVDQCTYSTCSKVVVAEVIKYKEKDLGLDMGESMENQNGI